jgi:hypothetical protein
LSTFEDNTFVRVFIVSLLHVYWSVEASKERIARFDGTWVLVVTNNSFVFDFSGLRIAPILCTCVVVVTVNWSVKTSRNRVARVNSARVVVVTVSLFINTSNSNVTSIFSTSVTIIARDSSVDAVSSFNIERICSTCVVVVTVLLGKYAFSSYWVAAGSGTCIWSREGNWGVDTNSRNTFVSGAWVVIVTINSSVDASFDWITFRFEALVCVIATDRIVNNSSVRAAPIFGTCIVIIQILWGKWFVSASSYRVATVLGAWVVIVTRNWFMPA